MLPDRDGRIRVRASFAGWVEYRVKAGDVVLRGGGIAVVEGDVQLETLCARNPSRVLSLHAEDGSEVARDALLATIVEIDEQEALAEAAVQHAR